ncbi:helix-turn-helix transcriptional regulator [Vibrio parahaemolyticus]|uniref:helix-turn-helix transcriptional regulator n=2 Tax=Vibrio parahaemolyticus TaxID=670 RepID=UPI00226B21F3|nr:helix-turn-helix transcriptional regulator [Vibrio parahaemolyticus]MCX8900663.1 helix-turn-helix domain-containing protein [Vibrio parahaemolyticus]MCX8920979.1 helix-turn-helix domain-containing protein [Vibrio parahaemolyticus]
MIKDICTIWRLLMIGSVLKEARTLKNLSQPDIAKLVGVTKQTYLKWENDVTEPKATQVNKLAKVLGISANEICAGKLDKKMSLNSFIINMSKIGADSGLTALRVWEQVPDHHHFLTSLIEAGDLEGKDTEVLNIL